MLAQLVALAGNLVAWAAFLITHQPLFALLASIISTLHLIFWMLAVAVSKRTRKIAGELWGLTLPLFMLGSLWVGVFSSAASVQGMLVVVAIVTSFLFALTATIAAMMTAKKSQSAFAEGYSTLLMVQGCLELLISFFGS